MAFENTAEILRTYNNNPNTKEAAERALDNGVGLLVVVVNAHDEATRGNVKNWLAPLKNEHPHRLAIIEMTSGYSWCNALNTGMAHIRHRNRVAQVTGTAPIDFVLNCSVEVRWKREHLEEMLRTANESSCVGVVGTSFYGRCSGQVVDLGVSYCHPRNTFMLIRMEVMREVGHFDAVCDGYGGMEDLFFLIEMSMMGNREHRHLDMSVPLLVGVNHDQAAKEKREREAMKKIIAHLRRTYESVPELLDRMSDVLETFGITDL